MKKIIGWLRVLRKKETVFIFLIIILSFHVIGCNDNDKKYSMFNIVKASVEIIKKDGLFALSAERINQEIVNMYKTDDDILSKESTLRQYNSDGYNDYNIIFEDRIIDDKEKKDREKVNPFKE